MHAVTAFPPPPRDNGVWGCGPAWLSQLMSPRRAREGGEGRRWDRLERRGKEGKEGSVAENVQFKMDRVAISTEIISKQGKI